MKVFLGLDTSCYTTSVAVFSETGDLLQDRRQILKVKRGGCGLMQNEMVYQHTRALPSLLEAVLSEEYSVTAIGVSEKPRPQAESYMPAFLVGLGTARSLAGALHVPLFLESHQENHLRAGLWSACWEPERDFLMLHASGGTTDVLLVKGEGKGFRLEPVGGSRDLHAGQFIDRVGVALDLQFPAGPSLERMAATAEGELEVPVSVEGCSCSLSGPATNALRKLAAGAEGAEVALATEVCLGKTFGRMLANGAQKYGVKDVLLVGGVASNRRIKAECEGILSGAGVAMHCAGAEYSCDGAVGNAFYAWKSFVGVK